jgi:hypothetical protein
MTMLSLCTLTETLNIVVGDDNDYAIFIYTETLTL